MNLISIIALLIILVMVIHGVIYIKKNGPCAGCPDAHSCSGHCRKHPEKDIKKDPSYKEKNQKIDDVMKKHGLSKIN